MKDITEDSMTDNIKVLLRVRPQNQREIELGDQSNLIKIEDKTITAINLKNEVKQYTYDYVAGPNSNQQEIFTNCAKQMCDNSLEGYNCTIFAYGQTGSGKTYTLLGNNFSVTQNSEDNENISMNPSNTNNSDSCMNSDENDGLIPRVIRYIFAESKVRDDLEFTFLCSFIEIYQEQISDLLDPDKYKQIVIRDYSSATNNSQNTILVDGMTKLKISSPEEALSIIRQGVKLRHIASTSMNKESSRSHAIFTLYIQHISKSAGDKSITKSVFNLIDLAGSERQRVTECVGERIKEAGNINNSLMILGKVINSLARRKIGHIPYRESKLTHLLKDSLGGNAKTAIIANVSPANSSISETISTLMFAQRAKQIENKAIINKETSSADTMKVEFTKLKGKYESIKMENLKLKKELEKTKRKPYSSKDQNIVNDSIEDDLTKFVEKLAEKDNELKALKLENESLEDKLHKIELDKKLKEKDIDDYKNEIISLKVKRIKNQKKIL